MKNKIVITFFLVLSVHSFSSLFGQQNFSPDYSMTLKAFTQNALEPKDEIWVVDFWASWCRPCLQSIPDLKKIHASFEGKPVRFISISWDENEQKWKNMLNRTHMSWQQLRIANPRAGNPFIDKHFPHDQIPSLFLISRSGKVRKLSGHEVLKRKIEKALED